MAPTNYVSNLGFYDVHGFVPGQGPPSNRAGVFWSNSATKIAEILDGTARTLAVSECRKSDPLHAYYVGDNAAYQACIVGQPGTPPSIIDYRGSSWFDGVGASELVFNSYYGPNDVVGSELECELWSTNGVFAARSWHGAGVHGLLCDGSVEFYSDSIDLELWRALSTMSGNETQ